MIIKITKRDDPYARIDNRPLNDSRLSLRARGLFAYLMSKPNNWQIRFEMVLKNVKEGRNALRCAFQELREAGYARLVNTRDGREWTLHEAPGAIVSHRPENDLCAPTEKATVQKTPHIVTKDVVQTKEPSAHAELVGLWTERYQKHFGIPYAFQGGKDGSAVKLLLASSKLPPAELIAIAEGAWKNGRGFFCKSATSLSGFNSKFNEIRQELKNGANQGHHSAGTGRFIAAPTTRVSQYAGIGKIDKV